MVAWRCHLGEQSARTVAGLSAGQSAAGTGDAADPYFGIPLWLQTRVRGRLLWAYNLDHLTLIENYVAADLRERARWYDNGQKMTLVAKLPRWVKAAGSRAEVLHAITRLRAQNPIP